MSGIATFLTRRRGGASWHFTDVLAWIWLVAGLLLMFGPVVWLGLSSFKTRAALSEFPPTLLPYETAMVHVEGFDEPLPLYRVMMEDGEERLLVQVRRIGTVAQMADPEAPEEIIRVPLAARQPVREIKLATENYSTPFKRYNFLRYFYNSVFVTVVATIITLIFNSMAAFALSKYEFKGRTAVLAIILATLMVPLSVIIIPLFSVINGLNLFNSLWGVILPTVATPTGVFLLRQYMLTIPDELLEAARMDHASEWKIYWRIVLPLAMPAVAVLAIFSVMWRWNDFLWPLIVLSDQELYTLQVGLNSFQGELNVQWHYVLAMTVVSMLPVVVIFAFLQRFITSGIASTGIK
ncbi:carbohydrate ABC transporter permease [Chelativorans alearense]|uniref:carbohydrate ABC transporter permease n=1 Tax=Chelativorans alearense TaxID=2681495 RepID=UPI0013D062E7|nr:carbohydrate ABC transporter permease [Chelativorans alearense]